MKPEEQEAMMTTQEVTDFLKISRQTLHRLRKEGVIPTYKVGIRGVRFKRSDIEKYLQSRKQSS